MTKKILKVFGIIIGVAIIMISLFLYIIRDQLDVMVAVLEEDKDTISYYIDEKNFNPNDLYINIDIISYYLLNNKNNNIDMDFVNYLLDNGFDGNVIHRKSMYPLFSAIALDNIELLDILVSYDVDVNNVDYAGRTPLGISLRLFNCEISKLLIDKGANLNKDELKTKMFERIKDCEKNNWKSTNKLKL